MPDPTDDLIDVFADLSAEDYTAEIRASGDDRICVAPVKSEYLLEESAPTADEVEQQRAERSKRRGMNKNRRKEMAQMTTRVRATGTRLCPSAYMPGVKCKHGEKCTSEHSVEAFLSRKAPDLDTVCPVYEQRGFCPFSYSCRFGHAHLSEDLQQTKKEVNTPYLPTMNAKNMHIQVAMRKRRYDFSRSEAFLDTLPDSYRDRKGARASAPSTGEFQAKTTVTENKMGAMEREKKIISMKDLAGKKYVAPLTTVGNLPFRRICVELGADITCGEMAVATSILGGIPSEFSLVKRHPCEKIFGVQLAGGFADTMTMTTQIVVDEFDVDFVDINMGCPIDVVNQKGGGCALPTRPTKLYDVMRGMRSVLGSVPLTIKLRTGLKEGVLTAHETVAEIMQHCPPDMITLHPRSKEQRYTKLANWDFVYPVAEAAKEVPLWVCGDVISWQNFYERLETHPIGGIMIARGALIKPWLMTEIDEKRDWDITATERMDLIKKFVWYGLDHWGSDDAGIEKTRRFLMEWLSFTCRYIPVGLMERLPQLINERPPVFRGRNEMETLLASSRASDWLKIAEMYLGPCPEGFTFIPKHKASSY